MFYTSLPILILGIFDQVRPIALCLKLGWLFHGLPILAHSSLYSERCNYAGHSQVLALVWGRGICQNCAFVFDFEMIPTRFECFIFEGLPLCLTIFLPSVCFVVTSLDPRTAVDSSSVQLQLAACLCSVLMWHFGCFWIVLYQREEENLFSSMRFTARAHMIKIWLFVLYYLNCWFLGNQTWSDDAPLETRVSYGEKGITAFRVKVTAKGQNVNVCPDDIF